MAVIRRAVVASLGFSFVLPALLAAQRSAPHNGASSSTTVGPAHGTVIVVGGGAMGPEIYSRFIQAAGGPDALIIDVPNAGGGTFLAFDAGRSTLSVEFFNQNGGCS